MPELYKTIILAWLLLCLSGCTGMAALDDETVKISRSLLDGAEFGLSPGDRPPPAELTAVDERMRDFLAERVSESLSNPQKIRRILEALLDDGLKLQYHNYKTFTARETFRSREGNCMSFTNLFIALAREAGLKVSYQEVEVPPSWGEEAGSWMFSKHINALVKLPDNEQVVDFNLAEFRDHFPRYRISDRAALARYHNNLGAHWMSEGDTQKAFLHFRQALQLDAGTAYFWTNLGSLFRRDGHAEQAEQAYRIAIEMSGEPAAMSNLARLYREQGRGEQAREYEEKVDRYRRRNPFYLFHLAEEAYASADYEEAGNLLRRAIAKYERSHEFYRLLGLTYLQLQRPEEARRQFKKALALAEGGESEARYRHKLDLLANY